MSTYKVYLRSTWNGQFSISGDVPANETLTVTLISDDGTVFMGSVDTPSNEYTRQVYRVIVREAAKIVNISYTYFLNDSGPVRSKTREILLAKQLPLSCKVDVW